MRILTRTVWILSVVSLFADIASEMLYPVVPVYLQKIGFTILWIGVLEGLANFTSGISKGYFGKLSDEKGMRLPFIRFGYFFSSISKPMMAMFTAPVWIFFSRTLDRFGKGLRTAPRDALLSKEATKETKGSVFGFHRAMDTVGATLGPIAAVLFLSVRPGEYKTVFYLAFIPGIISVILLFLLKEKKQPSSTLRKGNFFSFFGYWKIATPEYKKLATGLFLFAVANSSDIFLLLRTKQITGSDSITIGAYIFYNLVYALLSYPLGRLGDRYGLKKVFLSGLFLFCLVYAGFAFAATSAQIFALFFLYGIYAAATDGITKAWITNIAHENNTATAIGFYTSGESICTLLSSIIAGFIWTKTSSSVTFICTSTAAFIVFFYLIVALKQPRQQAAIFPK
jgi:MFS family permease